MKKMMMYKFNNNFCIDVGFVVKHNNVLNAATLTNSILSDLPSTLYRSIDFKTTSSIIGSIFCDVLSRETRSLVNPIEKGHPDLVPLSAQLATEEQLRNYPQGLEIKCTIGNIKTGANLRAGFSRVDQLSGITWQAHHREVSELMGIVWDFASDTNNFLYPMITGIFYSNNLLQDDWGAISGTSGRNTKVTGMKSSGKNKMGNGWIILLDEERYAAAFQKFLGFTI